MNKKFYTKILFLLCSILCLVSCAKRGLYEQLPGDPYVQVEDDRNLTNKVGNIVLKDKNGKKVSSYYVHFFQGKPIISTPSLVTDTIFVSIPPQTDISQLRMILSLAKGSMVATIKDTNMLRKFEPMSSPFTRSFLEKTRTYTLIDTTGMVVTFSNGYVRHYHILLEILDVEPPRIYAMGSYTGGLDSVDYNDQNQEITIYRSPANTDLIQTLNYKVEPENAVISSNVKPGSIFDFSSANQQTIPLSISVPDKDGKMVETIYKVKLHLGWYKTKLVMDGLNTSANYTNSANEDKEYKVAIDENYVYVLTLNRDAKDASGSTYKGAYQRATYDLYAYPIQAKAGTPIKMNIEDKKIIDIVSVNNTLYAIVMIPVVIGGGANSSDGSNKLQIVKWDNVASGLPIPVTAPTANATVIPFQIFTANVDMNNNNIINFYSLNSAGAGIKKAEAFKLAININGDASIPLVLPAAVSHWDNTLLYGAGYSGTYLDIPEFNRGIVMGTSGFAFGTNYANNPSSTDAITFFTRYTKPANVNAIGANIAKLRGKYYFIHTTVIDLSSTLSNDMYVIDLGTNVAATLDNTTSASQFYGYSVYSDKVGNKALTAGNLGNRGNCRTYTLPNGRVRIVSLVATNGFKVWELQ